MVSKPTAEGDFFQEIAASQGTQTCGSQDPTVGVYWPFCWAQPYLYTNCCKEAGSVNHVSVSVPHRHCAGPGEAQDCGEESST